VNRKGGCPIKRGKVYLVGAGPGHPELLTLKAAELLRIADAVVYDRLVQQEVLTLAKPSAERIYMGKPVGKHESRQAEIHELLVRKAREGKIVVRLKGGDPFVLGRGGEEAEYLAERGVPFEVIPGVSSALAAPLGAGIAVTHREVASSVAIVTGHEASLDPSRIDWEALSRLETLVFLMAVHNVGRIAQRLIEHGRKPETPAAMIQMAFWHDERVVTGTLATIADEVQRAEIKPPATLVVGEVVRLHEKLKDSQRDLRRRPDGSSRFEPAPAPDQLLRLATSNLATQIMGFALELAVFDRLEQPTAAEELASQLRLNGPALVEILDALVALGLLELGSEGYRNLELASRYLRSDSPESLQAALLYQAAQSGNWEAVARYARSGCREFIPGSEGQLYHAACESLARFAAPLVVERLDLGQRDPVLLLGWGAQAYQDAVARRWPQLTFTARNPFTGADRLRKPFSPVRAKEGPYGAILLSGVLASANRGEVQALLEAATSRLRPDGVLVLHDAFLPASALPPPEVILGGLGRRIRRGGCRTWSVGRLEESLRGLGFAELSSEALPAGTTLVTAARP
jgi:uroporphyrin-III C-methyltransferase